MKITFWRQPGNKTWKRTSSEPSRHVSHVEVGEEIKRLTRDGWKFSIFDHKMELIKEEEV